MKYKYQIGGLNFLSDIKITTLRKNIFNVPDFKINLVQNLPNADKTFQILDNGNILYKDVHGNIFLISHSKISISIKNKKFDEAANSILGIPIGFLLQKNNFQVIHGSSIASGSSAVCFIGKSGVGKSSIASNLIDIGLKLVTEDLCIIKDKKIHNFSNWIKLAMDSLPKNLEYNKTIKVKEDARRRTQFNLKKKYISEPKVNLRALYFLENNKTRSIKKITKADSFKYLFTYAYRVNDTDIESLKKLTEISEYTECYLFSREIEKPLKDNLKFISNHLNDNYF